MSEDEGSRVARRSPAPRGILRTEAESAREARRESSLEEIFGDLSITKKSDCCGHMLIYHHYVWQEGVTEAHAVTGANFALTRLSIDVLLPGPTVLEQLEVSITGKRQVKVKYKPPATYLNNRRNAVRSVQMSGMGLGGRDQVAQETMIGMMTSTSRSTGHAVALQKVIPKQKEIEFFIDDLPFDIDPYLCRRDDWGNAPTLGNPGLGGKGVEIGFYRHESPAMHAANQHVWILHIECTAAERPINIMSPTQPQGFGDYQQYA